MLEIIVHGIDIWQDSSTSELTVYRRVAALLDHLFMGTAIELVDGECTSESTKAAMALYNSCTGRFGLVYGRKIDWMTIVGHNNERIELSANEWKRANVSDTIALTQQAKNLRSNATILSKLIKMGCTPAILAMDWIGMCGYLYYLTFVEQHGIFVANTFAKLVIPTSLDDIESAVTTINALFKWRV
ncbi:hypothetical protein DM01DRAFT_251809 [Hesseltinella vesiculosa]|uniref:Uncharacterized protein n=1 Tax=Hesseltinella vesiculosa TaxID=101127 RepID=A0A1X2GCX6_9FUNG|nr:hypothetical protein DM01DRAFT_251809 [Hesseltinella vesiculosa]